MADMIKHILSMLVLRVNDQRRGKKKRLSARLDCHFGPLADSLNARADAKGKRAGIVASART
jgi:hypothetical protein